MSKGAHCEGEAGAGSLDGEDSRADISVVLEVIHKVRSRACLHAAIDAHVSLLRPVQRITAGEKAFRRVRKGSTLSYHPLVQMQPAAPLNRAPSYIMQSRVGGKGSLAWAKGHYCIVMKDGLSVMAGRHTP